MQYPSTSTVVGDRILAVWLITLQSDTQLKQIALEVYKAATQCCLWHSLASSELLGEMCTNSL